jgi:hypothetical protein
MDAVVWSRIMITEFPYDRRCLRSDGVVWAATQNVTIIQYCHPRGFSLLSVDSDRFVETSITIPWEEYYVLSPHDVADVYKRLVAAALAARRMYEVDLFA